MSFTLAALEQRFQTMIGDEDATYADKYADCINDSSRELYPDLHKPLIDETLVTGNILPNSHFEYWASTSYPDRYNKVNATCAETTSAGLTRGGVSSSLVSPSAADGYMFITSGNTSEAGYPRLLDIAGNTITIATWGRPSTADDLFMDVYYIDSDGNATTVSTTTTAIINQLTLLKRTDIAIPTGIKEIQFRYRVHTSGQTGYFDASRVLGVGVRDYMLPNGFQNGTVRQVWIQSSSQADDACDDLHPTYTEEIGSWRIINDGSYKYLHFDYTPSAEKKIKLVGHCPLESLSSSTDTVTLDDRRVNLLLHYAAHLLYERQKAIVSSDDKGRYEQESNYHLAKAEMLRRQLKMSQPPTVIRWRY